LVKVFELLRLFLTFFALSLIFASSPIQTVYSSEEPAGGSLQCSVEITGGEPRMYPGQSAKFEASLNEAQGTENYTWTVEGPIIKDYDNTVFNNTQLNVSSGVEEETLMSPVDFQERSISFYWQPYATNETDTNRTVSVTVQTSDGKKCEDSRDFTVAKSTDDINKQAEDFYVHSEVLEEHEAWHNTYAFWNESYNDMGDLFFDFHNKYIKHFNEWRELFGYPAIEPWDPGTELKTGNDTGSHHKTRNRSYDPEPLPTWFQPVPGPENGNTTRSLDIFVPPCEEYDAPPPDWPFPTQDELSDFPPDMDLLGCALTHPYHNYRHGEIGGDMNNPSTAPLDPIFWRYHLFINKTAENRASIEGLPPSLAVEERAIIPQGLPVDTVPPRVFDQNPFRLYPFLTELPTISEQERDLFGVAGVPALSAEFDEPVTGVTAQDFTVNGSPATQVYGQGAGPYIFIGFETPGIGPVNVAFARGNITDEAGNRFEGTTWSYEIVEPTADKDIDGAMDGLEVNVLRSDPNLLDSDSDEIPDGLEATSECLDPLLNDVDPTINMSMLSPPVNSSNNSNNTHGMIMDTSENDSISLDSDSDDVTNVQEIENRTDPCSLEQPQPAPPLLAQNISSFPFAIVIQKSGGIAGSNATSILSYDSLSEVATSIVNGSEASRQISDFGEAERILNNSGFFGSATTFYPPASASADYIEFTVIATLNGRVYAGYWTDTSEEVPEGIRNLPYIMAYVLGTGRVF
jgi:hypothetical protein